MGKMDLTAIIPVVAYKSFLQRDIGNDRELEHRKTITDRVIIWCEKIVISAGEVHLEGTEYMNTQKGNTLIEVNLCLVHVLYSIAEPVSFNVFFLMLISCLLLLLLFNTYCRLYWWLLKSKWARAFFSLAMSQWGSTIYYWEWQHITSGGISAHGGPKDPQCIAAICYCCRVTADY